MIVLMLLIGCSPPSPKPEKQTILVIENVVGNPLLPMKVTCTTSGDSAKPNTLFGNVIDILTALIGVIK